MLQRNWLLRDDVIVTIAYKYMIPIEYTIEGDSAVCDSYVEMASETKRGKTQLQQQQTKRKVSSWKFT